jgi:hypothetical protein
MVKTGSKIHRVNLCYEIQQSIYQQRVYQARPMVAFHMWALCMDVLGHENQARPRKEGYF